MKKCKIKDNYLILNNQKIKLIHGFKKKYDNDITDFEINEELPNLVEKLTKLIIKTFK